MLDILFWNQDVEWARTRACVASWMIGLLIFVVRFSVRRAPYICRTAVCEELSRVVEGTYYDVMVQSTASTQNLNSLEISTYPWFPERSRANDTTPKCAVLRLMS